MPSSENNYGWNSKSSYFLAPTPTFTKDQGEQTYLGSFVLQPADDGLNVTREEGPAGYKHGQVASAHHDAEPMVKASRHCISHTEGDRQCTVWRLGEHTGVEL